MSRSIVFRPAAREEFDAAGDWYEGQRAGLGAAFTTAVQRVLNRVAAQPDFYPVVWRGIREALVHGFPYCVYYKEDKQRILVTAVFHTSRDPSNWQKRQ